MKKQLLFIVSCVTFATAVNAQNLVPNPSFEIQDTCPAVSQIELAQPWVSASIGTPDLFNNSCASQNASARTGVGSSGVYTYSTFANNREYMEVPLTNALVAGQTYCVSFYVKRTNFRYACNRIGAYLSNGLVDQNTTGVFAFTPQVDNNPNNMLSSGWMNVSGSFVADGGEDHMIIGNFSNDAGTDTIVANSGSSSKVCYYQVDDVSLIQCFAGLDENTADLVSLFPNPASESITIQLENALGVQSISIINAIGKEVMQVSSPSTNGGVITLTDMNIPDGVYIVRMFTDKGLVNKQLVIRN